MADLILSGSTSGAVTLSAPAVSGSTTLSLPATSGTVLTTGSTFAGTGPAFSAYQSSAQATVTGGIWTKVVLQAEEFDTNANFDNVTNYRFTPTVAGYYQVNGGFNNNATAGQVLVAIFKNGAEYKRGVQTPVAVEAAMGTLVHLNGSTDYVELYVHFAVTSTVNPGLQLTYFNGFLARAA